MLAHRLLDRPKFEIVEIFQEYEAARKGLGMRFLMELVDRIDLIQRMPEMYAISHSQKNYRIGQMKPFPQLIIYSVEANEIVVHALIHGRRNLEALWRGLP